MKTRGGLWRRQDMTRDGKRYDPRVPSGLQAYLSRELFAHNANLEGTPALTPRPCVMRNTVPHHGEKTGPVARALRH